MIPHSLIPALPLLVLSAPCLAQTGLSPQSVIAAQVECFRAGDFEAAFGYASDSVRQVFGTTDAFADMVRQGYPMVIDPRNLLFLDLREVDGVLIQKVLVTDAAGTTFLLEYRLVPAGESLRISGVRILPQSDVGV